jgi:hypothetical protein
LPRARAQSNRSEGVTDRSENSQRPVISSDLIKISGERCDWITLLLSLRCISQGLGRDIPMLPLTQQQPSAAPHTVALRIARTQYDSEARVASSATGVRWASGYGRWDGMGVRRKGGYEPRSRPHARVDHRQCRPVVVWTTWPAPTEPSINAADAPPLAQPY